MTYVSSHNHAKFKVDFYDSLLFEEILKFQNVIVLTEPVFNKNKNHYYENIFSEKMFI